MRKVGKDREELKQGISNLRMVINSLILFLSKCHQNIEKKTSMIYNNYITLKLHAINLPVA